MAEPIANAIVNVKVGNGISGFGKQGKCPKERPMTDDKYPEWFLQLRKRHSRLLDAVDTLGKAAQDSGPLDEKIAHLSA